MASGRPIDEKIVKMGLDNAKFMKDLDATIKSLTDFKAKVESSVDVKSSKFDNFTSGIVASMGKLIGKVPILNSFKKSVEDSTDVKTSKFESFSSGIISNLGKIVGKIPILGSFKKQVSDSINVSSAPMDKLSENVASDVGRINGSLSTIGNGVSEVAGRFSILAGAASVALGNIVTDALQKGKEFASAFTIDPVKDGFNEYELKMKSITTIMTNTGRSVGDVNKILNDLNTYSDKTIYGFSDMTTAIGSMASAGIGLEDAGHVVKGFYNAAAATGVEAGRMGSLLQTALVPSLSRGYMGLQDFRQLSDAGFGQGFKDQLLKTAKAMGKNVDETTAFTDGLKDGWASTDVLIAATKEFEKNKAYEEAATKVKTLSALIDTTKEAIGSGWAQTWETVFGNTDQAAALFTPLSNILGNMVNESSNARKAMLDQWIKIGGRDNFVTALTNGFKLLAGTVKIVKDSFKNVFGITAEGQAKTLNNVIVSIGKVLEPTSAKMKAFGDIAKGFFSLVQLLLTPVRMLGTLIGNMIPKGAGGGLLDMIAALGRWLTSVNESVQKGEGLKNIFKTIKDVAQQLQNGIKSLIGMFGQLNGSMGKVGSGAAEKIANVFDSIGKSFKDLFGQFNSVDVSNLAVLGALGIIIGKIGGIFKVIKGFTGDVKGSIDGIMSFTKAFDELPNSLKALTDNVKANTLKQIAVSLALLAGSLLILSTIKLERMITSMTALVVAMKILQGGLDGLVNNPLKLGQATAAVLALNGMATAMLILSAAIKVLSTMDMGELAKGLGAIAVAMTIMVTAMKLMGKIGPSVVTSAGAMVLIATALNLLVVPIEVLGHMKWEDLAKGLAGVAAGMLLMVAAMATMSKIASGPKLMAQSAALIGMATAMLILSTSIKILGDMKWEDLAKGLVGVASALGIMAAASALIRNPAPLLGMATAMLVLSGALKVMGSMSMSEIGRSMIVLAGGLTILAIAIKLIGSNVSGAVTLGIMASALIPLAVALKMMSGLNIKETAQALFAMAGSLAVLIVAAHGLQGAVVGVMALAVAAGAMVAIAVAMKILAGAIKILSNIEPKKLAVGIIGLAGALAVLIGAGMLAGGAAIGLIALGGSFTLIGAGIALAGAGINDIASALMTLSKINMKAASSNFVAFFKTIVTIIPIAINAIIAAIQQILVGFTKMQPQIQAALISLVQTARGVIPSLVKLGSDILSGLQTLIPQFVAMITVLGSNILMSIRILAPQLAATLMVLLQTGLAVFTTAAPLIIDAGLQLVLNLLKGISDNMEQIAQTAVDILTNFIKGITDGLPQLIDAAGNLIIAFIQGIGDKSLDIVNAAAQTLITFINGLADSIDTYSPQLHAAVDKLMHSILNAILDWLGIGDIVRSGQQMIDNFIQGAVKAGGNIWNSIVTFFTSLPGKIWGAISSIGSKAGQAFGDFVSQAGAGASRIWGAIVGFFTSLPGKIWGAISSIGSKGGQAIGDFISGLSGRAGSIWGSISGFFTSIPGNISSAIGDLTSIGGNIVQGVIDGVTGAAGKLANSVKDMASNAIDTVKRTLGIHSPSRVMRDEVGKFIPLGLANGIDATSSSVIRSANGLVNGTRSVFSQLKDGLDVNMNLDPTITPVLDLSNIHDIDLNSSITTNRLNGQDIASPTVKNSSGILFTGNINIPINVPEGTSQQQIATIDSHLRSAVKNIISDEIRKGL